MVSISYYIVILTIEVIETMSKNEKMYCPICGKYKAPYNPDKIKPDVCRRCYEQRRPEFAQFRDIFHELGDDDEAARAKWQILTDNREKVYFEDKNENENTHTQSAPKQTIKTDSNEPDIETHTDNTPDTDCVWRCEHCNTPIKFAERKCHNCGQFVDWRVQEVISHPTITVCNKYGTISTNGTCELCGGT
ncbi:MAG: hypothetical protein SYNGOMJ08_00382 [Candidatus Syntrophoarchaeum sp. GoM_oil]|nr:MAG: hypothetical protein SYNGOMJ08_00382 [Candidatus Syntrophoarchaeum sp. GoM_oil]